VLDDDVTTKQTKEMQGERICEDQLVYNGKDGNEKGMAEEEEEEEREVQSNKRRVLKKTGTGEDRSGSLWRGMKKRGGCGLGEGVGEGAGKGKG
jgi:hypothetical protein